MLLQSIKNTCPKAYLEFAEMARAVLNQHPSTQNLPLDELPFEIVFGLTLKFFKENELDFDYNNLSPQQYEEEIMDIFTNFEQVISHYS
jgi:hypothetical protein